MQRTRGHDTEGVGAPVLQGRLRGRQSNSLPRMAPSKPWGRVNAVLEDREGGRRVRGRQVTCWQKQGTEKQICRCCTAGLEAGGRVLPAKEGRWPLGAGKGRAVGAPWSRCRGPDAADPREIPELGAVR